MNWGLVLDLTRHSRDVRATELDSAIGKDRRI